MDHSCGTPRWALTLLVFCAASIAALNGARAQESPASSASDLTVRDETVQKKQVWGPLKGFSSYGAQLGFSRVMGGDVADGARLRPLLQASFRYRFNDQWVGTGDFGMTWGAFADRGDSVLAYNFGTLGALRTLGAFHGAALKAGGGFGMYRWNYKFKGKSIRDPLTQRFQKGFAPGLFLQGEAERRMTAHVMLAGSVQLHKLFNSDSEKWKTYFDQSQSILGFRLGIHYHWSPVEGILWERKKDTKVRIESGQGGK